ncbi:BCCT family transporter [Arthrobacter crystallopoietes]|uniref:BCCT family transporter n=1 Tax=Crystallibacter crystallopoietes TaxID=37928 RepID=UPI0011110C5B|nr:BCCT family transporter [Arthrobacter crystallopoietes]
MKKLQAFSGRGRKGEKEPVLNPGSRAHIDHGPFWICIAFFLAFIIAALIDIDSVGAGLNAALQWVSMVFGPFFSLLVFANVLLIGYLVISRYGSVRLGGDKPEMGFATWVSVMFCSAIAAGAVFFGPGEPLTHFSDVPPLYSQSVEARSGGAAVVAMQYSFLHWGISAWAIYGTFAIAIMVAAYHRGLPLRPSSGFYLLLGEKRVRGWWGKVIDIISVLAVVGGVMSSIGLLVIQLSYMLNVQYGVPNNMVVQFSILAFCVGVFMLSVVLGVERGIARLSRINVGLALVLGIALLIVGPTMFILNITVEGFGGYIQDFTKMSLFTDSVDQSGWLSFWTEYYWAWWLGWGPVVGLFLARISRGRTVRQILLGAVSTSSIALALWFGILGGTGMSVDISSGGAITKTLDADGMESALLSILNELPLSEILIPGFLVVLLLFLITTADSITLSAAIVSTGVENPPNSIRIIWGLVIGGTAAVLLQVGGVSTFQAAAIVTAPPIAFLLAGAMWSVPKQLNQVRQLQAPDHNQPTHRDADSGNNSSTHDDPLRLVSSRAEK